MFERRTPQTAVGTFFRMSELVYHGVVRNVRSTHGNALAAIFINVMQMIILVLVFYFMFSVLGLRGVALRGDFLVFIMSGIFLFMTHIKALGGVMGAEGPTSAMMKHAPMNTIVAIGSAMFGTLYIQILSACLVLYGYHVIVNPISFDQPFGTFFMFILAWFSGSAIGIMLLALKPWAPRAVGIVSQLYMRVNMIASGKMFVANSLPGYMRDYFDWNPLFHAIDQARGFAFLNYAPRYTEIAYPLILSGVLIMIGLMLEFTTRRAASQSWSARD